MKTSTITILFTDVVGSTDWLGRLGASEWDGVRRRHFSMLRGALAEHDGVEVKNTGDGLMAVFRSTIHAVECATAMQARGAQVVVGGAYLGIRIGIATGEATEEDEDWFGPPVVEAARLCALAGTNEIWATALVPVLAGSQTAVEFVALGPQTLKGFDEPVEVHRVEWVGVQQTSMFADIEQHERVGDRLIAQLDYWDSLPALDDMRLAAIAELDLHTGDVACDIGCGTGTELVRLAGIVGSNGRVIGVDPSPTMIAASRERAASAGVEVQLVTSDGRTTGLPDACCDGVRIERVIQHVGDLPVFLAEAQRITRPGGRVVVADTDWGSLMVHPGDPELIRRVKAAIEHGPRAEPWAGRFLHGAMLDAGLHDVRSQMFPIGAGPNATSALLPILERFATAHVLSRTEIDDFIAGLEAALQSGSAVVAFTMFVASGRVDA